MESGAATCLHIALHERGMGRRYLVLWAYRFFTATFLFGWKFYECIFINSVRFFENSFEISIAVTSIITKSMFFIDIHGDNIRIAPVFFIA
jgi:hypothetical protein